MRTMLRMTLVSVVTLVGCGSTSPTASVESIDYGDSKAMTKVDEGGMQTQLVDRQGAPALVLDWSAQTHSLSVTWPGSKEAPASAPSKEMSVVEQSALAHSIWQLREKAKLPQTGDLQTKDLYFCYDVQPGHYCDYDPQSSYCFYCFDMDECGNVSGGTLNCVL